MAAQIAFGRYVLLDKLAVGGMAELFFAKVQGAAGFEKACVIKRVLPHLAESPEFVEMFLDEARIAARLSHPGIVQVFDLGRQDQDYFIAMEYLAGEDVQAALQRCAEHGRRLPIRIAVRIAARAAEALQYAHELTLDDGTPLGLVHRDVSPSNLFVTYQGTVKVLDFGIARARTRSRVTQAGQVKGKLPYMAPEQLRSGRVDRRADVWSLAVTLYEMLVGERPFSSSDWRTLADAIKAGEFRAPAALRPDIPAELSDAIVRALAPDLGARTPDADTFRREIQQAVVQCPEPDVPLAQFWAELFGPARVAERMRLGRGAPVREPSATEPLGRAQRTEPLPRQESTAVATRLSRGSGDSRPSSAREATQRLPTASPKSDTVVDAPAVSPVRKKRTLIAASVLSALVVSGSAAVVLLRHPRPSPVVAQRAPDPKQSSMAAVAVPPPVPAPAEDVATTEPVPAETPRPRAEPALLSLTSNVPADAWVDGNAWGSLPIERHLRAGAHRIEIRARFGAQRTDHLTLIAGAHVSRRFTFGKGALNVDAEPWADVWLDGTQIGQTPLAGREVWEGPHQLRLVGPHGEKTVNVVVTADKTAIVDERLEP